uniref:Uncharacterized protein n=1 Tax=Arundo donax TaxID=35708 RepID=A0A0A8YR32_ARUDO
MIVCSISCKSLLYLYYLCFVKNSMPITNFLYS